MLLVLFGTVALLVGARDARATVGGSMGSLASSGPVAAYNFNAGSGTTLADLSGNGSNGTIAGASWSSAGHSGGALSFDGNADWVTIPDASNLDLTSAMTLEAWVYPSQLGSFWRTIITKEQSNGLVYGLFANSDSATPAAVTALPAQDIVRGSNRLLKSTWTYVAATYDGAALRLYVNGIQAASVAGTGAMPSSTQPLRIGGNSMGSQWFRGRIDDVRVYNRALSASEIQSDMQTAVAADAQAPSAPTSLAISGATTSSVSLSWAASTDNVGVAGYTVYRNGAAIGSTTTTSFQLSGLACGTNYTLSVDAFDAAGNRSGKTSVAAATSACPPPPDSTPPTTPSGLATSGATATSVTLSWNASTDDVGVAGYGLYRNSTSAGTTTTRTYTFSGLTCGTNYTLAVDAYDAMGNRSPRASISAATTACGDTAAPSAPTGLVASGATGTSITVSWTASADNVGVAGYGSYRNGSLIASGTGTSYTFSGLTCGTSYALAVDAYDAAGNRSAKTSLNATTAGCVVDAQPPSAPPNERYTGVTQSTISLAWDPSTDNVSVAGYSLFLNNVKVATTTQLSYTFSGLTCGTTYTVSVQAFDAAGNSSDPAYSTGTSATAACTQSGDTQAPTAPSALAATGATTTSISVGWGASLDNVGVAGYGQYRNGTSVGSSAGTSYTFTGLACGTSYSLAVDAYDAAGNRSAKATMSAATAACAVADTQPPTVPQGRVMSGATGTSFTMTWLASTDNVGVAGYRAYLNGAQVATTTQLTYTYTGLTCGTTYTVALEAFDAAGNVSDRSLAQGPATTSPCPAAPTGGSAAAYVSPVGSDAGSCTQSAPCRTLDRAYHVAAPGAVVELAAGSYGDQTITSDTSKTSASDVIFRPAAGAQVTLGDLTVDGDHLEVRDVRMGVLSTNTSADDVTFRNTVNRGIFIEGSSNVSLLGGEVTCGVCDYHSQISAEYNVNVAPTNILIDGVNFHDWQAATSGQHTECLQIGGGNGITIRNSTFKNCSTATPNNATGDLHVSWYGFGPVTRNVLIEGNFFYESGNPFAIQANDFANLDIRYNSIAQPIVIFGGFGDGTAVDLTGNVLTYTPGMCSTQPGGGGPAAPLNWRYNVLAGGTCGSSDRNAPGGFIDPATNLHLASTSAAVNRGDPGSYPGADIDGTARPIGGAPDAGADEVA
jgi:chitodextrinase